MATGELSNDGTAHQRGSEAFSLDSEQFATVVRDQPRLCSNHAPLPRKGIPMRRLRPDRCYAAWVVAASGESPDHRASTVAD
jgi:hypothetical protein